MWFFCGLYMIMGLELKRSVIYNLYILLLEPTIFEIYYKKFESEAESNEEVEEIFVIFL